MFNIFLSMSMFNILMFKDYSQMLKAILYCKMAPEQVFSTQSKEQAV